MKPLLKWAGGKSRVAHLLAPYIGRVNGLYIEPFFGAGGMGLHMLDAGLVDDNCGLFMDANERLMGFHKQVRDNSGQLADTYGAMPRDPAVIQAQYGAVRYAFNTGSDPVLQAARLLWLNRTCFNGLYRVNLKGDFNVPVGRNKTYSFPTAQDIHDASNLTAPCGFQARGFEAAFDCADTEGDVVYCDPPYVPLDANGFVKYTAAGFGLEDHYRLAKLAYDAAQYGVRVVISNHDSVAIRDLYQTSLGWTHHTIEVRRSVGRTAASRKTVTELVACIGPDALP